MLHDHLKRAKAYLKGQVPGADDDRIPGSQWWTDSAEEKLQLHHRTLRQVISPSRCQGLISEVVYSDWDHDYPLMTRWEKSSNGEDSMKPTFARR